MKQVWAQFAVGARLALALLSPACSEEGASSHGGGDAGGSDAAVTDTVRKALAALALAEIPPPPPDITNLWADDPEAALLGQRLFYDTGFSGRLLDGDNDGSEAALGVKGETGKVACAGCHLPESGFSDTRSVRRQISLASGWVLRRTPSLLDVSRSRLIAWGGRRDSLFSQPFGPIESAVEMNSSRLFAAAQVFRSHRDEYESIFGKMPPFDDTARFPALSADETGCDQLDADNKCTGVARGAPGDQAEFDGLAEADKDAVARVIANMGKALGAYQRLLSCGTSRFDAWVNGDATALDESEQRGAALFVTKGECVKCHSGPFFSDEEFHNVGLRPTTVATVFVDDDDRGAGDDLKALLADPLNSRGEYSDGDDGRLPGAVTDAHVGAFRTPRLRCASRRPSFMHTGQLRTLDEVVAFFSHGGDKGGFFGVSELSPIDLTPDERADLVAFMKALDGAGPPPELLGPP